MSRHNDYYNAVQRMYDLRQLNNQHAYDLRKQEVYRCVPALEALDRQLVSDSVQRIKASLRAHSGASSSPANNNAHPPQESIALQHSLSDYATQRKKLLTGAGFPEDYLEMQYHCPFCKDTGFVDEHRCKCFKSAFINLLYGDSALRNALETENFNTFSYDYYSKETIDPLTGLTSYETIQLAVETAKKFIADFGLSDTEPRNLLICGSTGVGKTFLTNCIAHELINAGHGIVYLSANELLKVLEDYKFRRNDTDDFETVYERYTSVYECDLLIIDDLGTELTNKVTITELFELLNKRQLQHRSTIISTNLSMQHIKETYSERIFSRIASNYDYIRIFGEDIRLKKL